MDSRRRMTVLGLGALAAPLCGCSLFGKEDPPEPDCEIPEVGSRELQGTALRSQEGGATFSVHRVLGRSKRKSVVPKRISVGDVALNSGFRLFGGLSGARDVDITQLDALPQSETGAAHTFSYREDGTFQGTLVAGRPAGMAHIPSGGRLRFSGPALVTINQLQGTAETRVAARGTINIVVGLSSRLASLSLTGLAGAQGTAGLGALRWESVALCGNRLVSTGQGRPKVTDRAGQDIAVSDPPPSAILDATLFRPTSGSGPSDLLGGAMAIQGDQGGIAALFLARAIT